MITSDLPPTTPHPNFFIVGAPKCGTTSLFRYLAGHPDVFVPVMKEPHYFGSDVRDRDSLDKAAYLRLFEGAAGRHAIGEASIWYLRSQDAAREIAAFEPRARIIAMVREPVSQLRSFHGHHVSRGIEEITDLGAAMEASTDRFLHRVTGRPRWPAFLEYPLVPRYAEQLERYFAVFPRRQIHVVVQEEFDRDTERVYADVLRFLGIDDTHRPDFKRYNVSRRTRHPSLLRLLYAPPPAARRLGKRLLPPGVRVAVWDQFIRRRLHRATSAVGGPGPVDPDLDARLRRQFGPEVHRLSSLIGRPDLPRLWGYGEDPVAGTSAVSRDGARSLA